MSKMAELSMLLDDLIKCGEELTKTAKGLRDFYTDTSAEEPQIEPPKEPKKELTHAEVRGALSEKMPDHKEEIREVLKKYGAEKLSEINPADYEALLKDVEAIDG